MKIKVYQVKLEKEYARPYGLYCNKIMIDSFETMSSAKAAENRLRTKDLSEQAWILKYGSREGFESWYKENCELSIPKE